MGAGVGGSDGRTERWERELGIWEGELKVGSGYEKDKVRV